VIWLHVFDYNFQVLIFLRFEALKVKPQHVILYLFVLFDVHLVQSVQKEVFEVVSCNLRSKDIRTKLEQTPFILTSGHHYINQVNEHLKSLNCIVTDILV